MSRIKVVLLLGTTIYKTHDAGVGIDAASSDLSSTRNLLLHLLHLLGGWEPLFGFGGGGADVGGADGGGVEGASLLLY